MGGCSFSKKIPHIVCKTVSTGTSIVQSKRAMNPVPLKRRFKVLGLHELLKEQVRYPNPTRERKQSQNKTCFPISRLPKRTRKALSYVGENRCGYLFRKNAWEPRVVLCSPDNLRLDRQHFLLKRLHRCIFLLHSKSSDETTDSASSGQPLRGSRQREK